MAKKSKWLLGCGLGCGGFLLLFILIGAWGVFLVKDTMSGFQEAIETRKTLEAQFGEPGDFTPQPDGSISKERIEVFLEVREATQVDRTNIINFFSLIPMNDEEAQELDDQPFIEKMQSVLKITKSAIGLGADIGRLFDARNKALIEKGMGMGEYSYIYVICYYSWLGHSSSDSPGNDAQVSDHMELSQPLVYQELIQMMSNQLDSLPAADGTNDLDLWRTQLETEIEEMKKIKDRVPWEDSVPDKISESLEPYRERLEVSYSPITNPFELSRPVVNGQFSISSE